MNLLLPGPHNQHLRITTAVAVGQFDGLACSAHSDGFTVLNSLRFSDLSRAAIRDLCVEVHEARQVRALPVKTVSGANVFLMPVVKSAGQDGRQQTAQLMRMLFLATQVSEFRIKSLLITQFAHVRRYPRAHVLGVFDELVNIAADSFQHLETVGIEIRAEDEGSIREDARQVLKG